MSVATDAADNDGASDDDGDFSDAADGGEGDPAVTAAGLLCSDGWECPYGGEEDLIL